MAERQENEVNSIEVLPNELFGQIFSYLNGIDASFAFSYLNTRFQCLLTEYCRRFDFLLINKIKFDIFYEQYDTQWCKSLRLSNDDDTHGQIEYFFRFYSLIDHFSQLKSLSLLNAGSIITSQIVLPTNLVSLTLKPVCGKTMSELSFFNLKRLAITSCKNTEWIKKFPQLESVEYTINNCCLEQIVLTWPSKLKYLKIIFAHDDVGVLVPQSLVHLSQLITLEIYQKELSRSCPNGELWEQLIRSSFPLLKKFKFYFQFDYGFVSINKVKRVISSFSRSFYLDEKKWYIRCDVFTASRIAIIYSLPFTFDRYTIFEDSSVTLLNSDKINSSRNLYENMKTLIVESFLQWDLEDQSYEDVHKISILDFISGSYFNSVERVHLLPKYYGYRKQNHIKILSNNFYIFLKKIPRLHTLEIDLRDLKVLTDNWSNISLCNYLAEKIRSLKLHANNPQTQCYDRDELEQVRRVFLKLHANNHQAQCYDGDELEQVRRVFSATCQHLSVCFLSPINTVTACLRDMQQLQSLHVLVQTENDAEITMKWLEKQKIGLNYSNCFIVHHKQNYYFWLGRY